MILDFGVSNPRYYVALASWVWTNGAPGGGAAPTVVVKARMVGYFVNLGKMGVEAEKLK